MTVGSRLGVVVDKGRREVHDQHRKGDRIRVVAGDSDDVDQGADQKAIDQAASVGYC